MAMAGLKWTQSDLSDASGVPVETISRVQTGASRGSPSTWFRLETALLGAGAEFPDPGDQTFVAVPTECAEE